MPPELAAIVPSAAELPLRVGDSHDTAFLSRLATEASVICSTVGPYARYGSELVSACAEPGTDYADLTGETQWIRRMIDRHHARAEETGARIVTCCGFDSIPSDIGTFMLQEHALASYGSPCTEVKLCVGKMRGSASGGTVASMLNIVDEVKKDRSVVRLLGHPSSPPRGAAGCAQQRLLEGFSGDSPPQGTIRARCRNGPGPTPADAAPVKDTIPPRAPVLGGAGPPRTPRKGPPLHIFAAAGAIRQCSLRYSYATLWASRPWPSWVWPVPATTAVFGDGGLHLLHDLVVMGGDLLADARVDLVFVEDGARHGPLDGAAARGGQGGAD
ncbi:MAG: hypothetical protein IPI67_04340 [Myxococcales bacterium]|nr:hypothetical protein [Myxococcales bacterium]